MVWGSLGTFGDASPRVGWTIIITLQESPSKSNKNFVTKTASFLNEAVSNFNDVIIFFAWAQADFVRSLKV
jgi:hypothetical protein